MIKERSQTPSPLKQRSVERGIFSSLSTLTYFKSTLDERRNMGNSGPIRSVSNLQAKRSPPPRKKQSTSPRPRSQVRQRDTKVVKQNANDEVMLKDAVKRLNQQGQKDKKKICLLETQLNELRLKHAQEIENLNKENKSLKQQISMQKNDYSFDDCKHVVKNLAQLIYNILHQLLEVDKINQSDKEGKYRSYIVSEIGNKLLRTFQQIQKDNKVQLDSLISNISQWGNLQKRQKFVQQCGDRQSSLSLGSEIGYHTSILKQHNGILNIQKKDNRNEMSFNEQELGVALYEFKGQKDGDLNFQRGDIIEIIDKNDCGWWTGKLEDRVGLFPYNFVKIV